MCVRVFLGILVESNPSCPSCPSPPSWTDLGSGGNRRRASPKTSRPAASITATFAEASLPAYSQRPAPPHAGQKQNLRIRKKFLEKRGTGLRGGVPPWGGRGGFRCRPPDGSDGFRYGGFWFSVFLFLFPISFRFRRLPVGL